jgi:hypothetical protein
LLVQEQLQAGHGVGVILSPRDLSEVNATTYAHAYRELGADVLIDPQFYVPDFTNTNLETYSLSQFRTSVASLHQISDGDLIELTNKLRDLNSLLGTTAVVAPAVLYEAGRPDIAELNARLFSAARQVGQDLGRPTYATVGLAQSATSSTPTLEAALAAATAFGTDADGWYYAFEFPDERLPSSRDAVLRCCGAGLALALTGKPVLHAYAGPMGLLSFGFGSTGAAVGHSQNLWKFSRDRWEPPADQGGGGNAPPRFFSSALWGTIVYPDETALLSNDLRAQILTPSQFCGPVIANVAWSRWDSGKHLVCVLATLFDQISATTNARTNAQGAISRLEGAVALHAAVNAEGLTLRDDADCYQDNWRLALIDLLAQRGGDFDYLDLL